MTETIGNVKCLVLPDRITTHLDVGIPTRIDPVGVGQLDLLCGVHAQQEVVEPVEHGNRRVVAITLWGIADLLYPRTFMERFREDFHLAETHRLDAKHFIQEDAPGEIAEAIEGFLTRTAA